jgi:uncharacterized protein
MKFVIFLLCVFVVSMGIWWTMQTIKPNSLPHPIAIPNIAPPTSTPTPFPFHEVTIPYLKSRTYQSSLGELRKYSQTVEYTSYLTHYTSDELKINGLLTIPTGTKPTSGWPAIVFVHGYIPPTIYKTTDKYNEYVDYLAKNGFVVFKIDLRGHGESQGVPSGAYFSSDYVIDTLQAVASLESSDFVNPKTIGVWGHSMAGNIVLRSLAVKPTLKGIVIWAGAVYSYEDRIKYGINDSSYRPPSVQSDQTQRNQRLRDTYGTFDSTIPFWQQIAPTNYLNDIQGAIEIHHAINDDVVNIGYSRDLMKLLDDTPIPHALFEYPNGGHNLTGASFSLAMKRTVEFFKKYLRE